MIDVVLIDERRRPSELQELLTPVDRVLGGPRVLVLQRHPCDDPPPGSTLRDLIRGSPFEVRGLSQVSIAPVPIVPFEAFDIPWRRPHVLPPFRDLPRAPWPRHARRPTLPAVRSLQARRGRRRRH